LYDDSTMPELPEVETIRRGLEEVIVNRAIVSVDVLDEKPIRNLVDDFKVGVINQKIDSIERVGKLLLIKLKSGKYLACHLKMTGQLVFEGDKKVVQGGHEIEGQEGNKYTRVIFGFEDGSKLFFNDLRKFGYLHLISEEEKVLVESRFGPDPTRGELSLSGFTELVQNRNRLIKALLLDQQLIAGIGNIYADESCFKAGVMPDRRANSLSAKEIKKLQVAIVQILNKAVECNGTTFRNYADSAGKSGNYSDYLCVFGRDGEECLVCGEIIQKQKTAGRGTHYCDNCQT
jgi:formamidopyrimidine-DNA glycosylase